MKNFPTHSSVFPFINAPVMRGTACITNGAQGGGGGLGEAKPARCWMVLWTREVLKVEEYFAEVRVRAGKIDEDWLTVRNPTQVKPGDKGVVIVKEKDGRPRAAYATFAVTGEAKRVKDDYPEYLVNPEQDAEKWRVRVRYDSVTNGEGIRSDDKFTRLGIFSVDIARYGEVKAQIEGRRKFHVGHKMWRASAAGNAEERKQIERAAVDAVGEFLEGRGYEVVSVETQNLGWDLEAAKGNASLLRVEVKGTKASEIHVELTPNEYGKSGDPRYRLAVVRNALKKPLCAIYKRDKQIWKRICGNDAGASSRLRNEERVAAVVKRCKR